MPRHKNADWIIAWAEGKEVEANRIGAVYWLPVRTNGDGNCYGISVFENKDFVFRFKPREPRRVWMNYYDLGKDRPRSYIYAHESKEIADKSGNAHRIECVEFVEVMPPFNEGCEWRRKPKRLEEWRNVYRGLEGNEIMTSNTYASKQDALDMSAEHARYVRTIRMVESDEQ